MSDETRSDEREEGGSLRFMHRDSPESLVKRALEGHNLIFIHPELPNQYLWIYYEDGEFSCDPPATKQRPAAARTQGEWLKWIAAWAPHITVGSKREQLN